MGWFDEQIEYRKKYERELLTDSFENIAKAVTGRKTTSVLQDDAELRNAISRLLKYFNIKEKEVPAKLKTLEDRLDYLLSASGVLYREVVLTKGWHHDAMGAMVATLREDGAAITLLPGSTGGYVYVDPHSGKTVHVGAAEEKLISNEALSFYRPLPMRRLNIKDLFLYMGTCQTIWDMVVYFISIAAVTVVGMLIPKMNKLLMGTVIDDHSMQLLFAVMSFMLFATIGSLMFKAIQSLLLQRICTKRLVNVNAAVMMRILSLPASFFKEYSAGELNQYITYLDSLCETMVNAMFNIGLTGLFSLVYLAQIFKYAPSLVLPSMLVAVITLAISILTSIVQIRINKEKMAYTARERGIVYSLITGIQKIRLSGAENRAFVKWSDQFAKSAELTYNPPMLIKLSSVITGAVTLIGTAVMYYVAVNNHVSFADYSAFNAAYGYISSAFTALAAVATTVATIRPTLEMVKPLMEAEPEVADGKETVSNLAGSIELSHVTFSYDADGKPLFDDLSLTIPAHQYVAIVGRSGCGKSTLMRLMLGFETPTRGAIYYDKKDMSRLDLRSLRRMIGTVMQDGKLFGGSIFENIVISAPTLKLKDAWDAAEMSGIADDIRAMPMGMNTVLTEGGGGISGGQRQRLMIARAVAPKPKILMFDEATSALDNITQKKVSEALDGMKCTRVIIAHRLSTIRHCDRILVLDGGRIVEDGTYEELIEKDGLFAELVERQRLDKA